MTLPDTGPERPGGLASDTREMAELDKMDDAVVEGGPAGHTFIVVAAVIIIGVLVFLLLR